MSEKNQNNQSKSNARGGKRPGAGRKKSAVTVKTREVAEKVISETPPDETPLAVMVRVMRRFWEEAEKKLESEDNDDRAAGLKLMKMSVDAASAAAPYIHPRLAAIEHTGKDGKDLVPEAPKGLLVVPGVLTEEAWEAMMAKHQEGAA